MGRGALRVGEDNLAGAGEVHVVARVLRALQRVGGAGERVPVSEAVGLLERDATVARLVSRTAQPTQQVVSEEGGLEVVGLLGLSPPELEVT